jgi:putative ABC transport system permease protein
LKGSILQGEIIITESQFTRLFPSISGYGFFLVDVSPAKAAGGQTRRQDAGAATAARTAAVTQLLERHLADFGCEVTPTARRLAELFAVQNTYLATFQTLGGLGLLLGTVGLAAVLLRNVWERRSELALMRTLGFSRIALGGLVLVENAFLVATGLLSGLISAAVVVAPHVASRETPLPWAALLLMVAVIFAGGLLAGAAALIPTLRAPLLPALRTE